MIRPVFITGASRSGTSLTAGLFAAHHVWFGPCMGASNINPKGFFESQFTKRHDVVHTPKGWRDWLAEHGAPEQWAVKGGPEWWRLFECFDPVVVCCYRDKHKIMESRKRAGFAENWRAIDKPWETMARIPDAFIVHPDNFIKGDFSEIIPAFVAAGISFDINSARSWVDPGLWSA